MTTLLAIWSVVATLGWLWLYRRVRRGAARAQAFEDVAMVTTDAWPKVSMIIPASNEAIAMPAALSSLRQLDYPNLEIIVIDDRSTDGTGTHIEAAAQQDPRIRAVRVDELPPGWLGKVHAQSRGCEQATGEWLLFTDADVVFATDAVKRAVGHAQSAGLDQLVIVGRGRPPTFILDVVECALATMLHGAAALSRSSNQVVGSGQFSMVKRSTFERSEGLSWLKMETADDFGLSWLMRNAGAKQAFLVSRSDVSWVWYPTFMAMVRGFEKNIFPVATGYRAMPAIIIATLIIALHLGPWLAPYALGVWGWCLPAAAVLALCVATMVRRRLSGRRWSVLLLGPLGQLILAMVLVRAMAVVMIRGGLTWRGTFYPIAALRAGQRVRQQARQRRA
jgi:glycosyltransferase involved in cell wall biosynthesis